MSLHLFRSEIVTLFLKGPDSKYFILMAYTVSVIFASTTVVRSTVGSEPRLYSSSILFTRTGAWMVGPQLWASSLIIFNFSRQCSL